VPNFSIASRRQLDTCEIPLQRVFEHVIVIYDCSILVGHRNQVDQEAAFVGGFTKLHWPNGKHNSLPSKAVDACPYHPQYGRLIGDDVQLKSIARANRQTAAWADQMIREHYCHMFGIVLGVGHALGIKLRWGGNWDSDSDLFDNSFDDLAHVELVP
jgi:peptidoglycan LD-endopeptidase CwlK